MIREKACALLSLVALAAVSTGVDAQTRVVRADRMLDVASGRIVPNAVVVVEGDRIARRCGVRFCRYPVSFGKAVDPVEE